MTNRSSFTRILFKGGFLSGTLLLASGVGMLGFAQTIDSKPQVSELDELSELDALSQTDEDPFGEIIVQKQREPISVTLRALDKIVARTIDLEVPMNSVATFGTLEIVPRTCDKRPPEDFPETTAFLQVFDSRATRTDGRKPRALSDEERAAQQAAQREAEINAQSKQSAPTILSDGTQGPETQGTRIFSGWMFASSPGLNALEHPVYDVWVIDCKTRLVDQSESSDEPAGN